MKELNRFRPIFACLCSILVVAGVGAGIVCAADEKSASETVVRIQAAPVHVFVGESARIMAKGVTKVSVSEPDIIQVVPMSQDLLVINGRKVGTAIVTLFEGDGDREIRVVVKPNFESIALRIQAAVNEPEVQVIIAEGNVILEGWVQDQDRRNRAVSIAGAFVPALRKEYPAGAGSSREDTPINVFNSSQAGAQGASATTEGDVDDAKAYAAQTPDGVMDFLQVRNQRQVRLKVQVVVLTKSGLKDFGLRFQQQARWGFGLLGGGIEAGITEVLLDKLDAAGAPVTSSKDPNRNTGRTWSNEHSALGVRGYGYGTLGEDDFLINNNSIASGYEVALRTLENKGDAKILARPVLTTLDGAEASFLAGGKFIITVPGSFAGGSTSTITEEIGVKVFFRPKIMPNGCISLFVTPKVADPPVDLGADRIFVPQRNTRNNVEVNPGDTVVLSGLFGINHTLTVHKMPWLADIPILGELFKNRVNDRTDNEVIFFVTPYIVDNPRDAVVKSDYAAELPVTNEFLKENKILPPAPAKPTVPNSAIPLAPPVPAEKGTKESKEKTVLRRGSNG
jgi:Flp pilus assembly secretin CpaC